MCARNVLHCAAQVVVADPAAAAGTLRNIGLNLKYVTSKQLPCFRRRHLVTDTKLVSHRRETWVGRP